MATLFLLLALFFCLLFPIAAPGNNISEYEIKGAMIVNFIRFATWPDMEPDMGPDMGRNPDIEASGTHIIVGIMGSNATFDAFAPMQGLRVNGRSLSVRHIDAIYKISECQVLFVDKSQRFRLVEIMDAVDGLPILTIGESGDFIKTGGLIRFYLHNNHIRFEINGKAAAKSPVRLGSQLMEIGKIVY